MKKKGLKGLLMVLVMVMGLALATGPANATCTMHNALCLGAAAIGNTTIGFILDLEHFPEYSFVYQFTTTNEGEANCLHAAAVLTQQALGLADQLHDPGFFFDLIPILNVIGDAPNCPLVDFGDAGNIQVINYFVHQFPPNS
jgi:hypothetical protein